MEQQPTDNKATYIKWGILALLVITGAIFLLPLFKTTAPSFLSGTGGTGEDGGGELPIVNNNRLDVKLRLKPVSSEAIAQRKQSSDQPWNDFEAQQNLGGYNAYWGRVQELFGKNSDGEYARTENEAYVSGFLKGMNLQQSVANVNKWLPFLNQYMSSPNRLFHYNISSPGIFLK